MPAGSFATIADLSPVAQILLAVSPLVAMLFVGVLLFFWLLWDHQRRLMIISRGGDPPPRIRPERLALIGVVSLFVGGALTLYFLAARGMGEAVLIGVVPAAAGTGIVVYQRLARGARDRGGA